MKHYNLTAEIARRGWTSRQAAKALGCTAGELEAWEADADNMPADKLRAAAELFGCSSDWLLDLTEERTRPEYVTTDEIMRAFSVTSRTVYRWHAAGRLHGTKAGRRLLFERAEVEALIGTGEGMGGASMSANTQ